MPKKNKLRKLIIDNKEYFWYVGDFNCDGDYGCMFQIYYNKKVIHKEIINIRMTPSLVKQKILEL